MENMICNRSENIDALTPYINKPVYIKGFCWNKEFDGWVVIYDRGKDWLRDVNLVFDYRGESYSVQGFLPNRLTMWSNSTYDNAIYKDEALCKKKMNA